MNNIINHFRVTGIDPHADRAKNQHFGFASSQTFEEALRNTAEVNSAFENLPSNKRAEFDNNPSLWLDSLGPAEGPNIDEDPIVDSGASEAPEMASTEPDDAKMDST